MIRSVNSDFPGFEKVVLSSGVNIILAERLNNSTNGLGKSLFLDCINYALGADYKRSELSNYADLQGYSITLEMDFEDELISVTRKISKSKNSNNMVFLSTDGHVSVSDWKQRLLEYYFNIRSGPSFFSWRSLLHFFFKMEPIKDFRKGLKSFSADQDYKVSAYQAFLLDIAYEEIKELSRTEVLRSEKKGFTQYINSLQKTAKMIPEILPDEIDNYTKMNQEINKKLNELKLSISSLQSEIDLLTVQERQLIESKKELEKFSNNSSRFNSLFTILNKELGEYVKKTFEESEAFNTKLLLENQDVINSELNNVQENLIFLIRRQTAEKNRMKTLIETKKFQDGNLKNVDISSVIIKELVSNSSNLISSKVDSGLDRFASDSSNAINEIIDSKELEIESHRKFLDKIVNYVYEAERNVSFDISFDKSLKIDFHYEDDSGTGKSNMKTIIYYCFLLLLNHGSLQRNIDFLILDTDVTDGIDSNNIYRLLKYMHPILVNTDCQLILTLKDDRDITFDSDDDKFWIKKRLYDGPGGYLFKKKLSKKR
ncbi:DUF2326 domain-containing protein [Enterococcus sp. AZ109]|uniref:DUF2326 domain-containing protein n=1 Tax=Enterococcus sp. AZ109 TaxID=2774634 RepID=UPI003F20033B